VENDFPPQAPVEGEPTSVRPVEPQLLAQLVPLVKRVGSVTTHQAPLFGPKKTRSASCRLTPENLTCPLYPILKVPPSCTSSYTFQPLL
jgi:hypothetical protein